MWRLLNRVSPPEAVRFFFEHRQAQFTPKKAPEVVEELIALKTAKRKSAKYVTDLRRPDRAGAFGRDHYHGTGLQLSNDHQRRHKNIRA